MVALEVVEDVEVAVEETREVAEIEAEPPAGGFIRKTIRGGPHHVTRTYLHSTVASGTGGGANLATSVRSQLNVPGGITSHPKTAIETGTSLQK